MGPIAPSPSEEEEEAIGPIGKFLYRAATEIRGRWRTWEIFIWISHGDRRAMAPMGDPQDSLSGIWIGHGDPRVMAPIWELEILYRTNYGLDPRETHVKSRKGDLPMIFAAKVCEATYKCTKRVVKLDRMQGLSAIPTQEKKIQQRKGSHCKNNSQRKKGAE